MNVYKALLFLQAMCCVTGLIGFLLGRDVDSWASATVIIHAIFLLATHMEDLA